MLKLFFVFLLSISTFLHAGLPQKEYYLLYDVYKKDTYVGMYRVHVNENKNRIDTKMYGQVATAKIPLTSNKTLDIKTSPSRSVAFADGSKKYDIYSKLSALNNKDKKTFKKIIKKMTGDDLLIVRTKKGHKNIISFSEKVNLYTLEDLLYKSIKNGHYGDTKSMLFEKEGIIKKVVSLSEGKESKSFNGSTASLNTVSINIKSKKLFTIFKDTSENIPVIIQSSKWKLVLMGAGKYKKSLRNISDYAFESIKRDMKGKFSGHDVRFVKEETSSRTYNVDFDVKYQYPSDKDIINNFLKLPSSNKLQFDKRGDIYRFSITKKDVCKQMAKENELYTPDCKKLKTITKQLSLKQIKQMNCALELRYKFAIEPKHLKKAKCHIKVEDDDAKLRCEDISSYSLTANKDELISKLTKLKYFDNMSNIKITKIKRRLIVAEANIKNPQNVKFTVKATKKSDVSLVCKDKSSSDSEEYVEKQLSKKHPHAKDKKIDIDSDNITANGLKYVFNEAVPVPEKILNNQANDLINKKVGKPVSITNNNNRYEYIIPQKRAKIAICNKFIKESSKSSNKIIHESKRCIISYSHEMDKNIYRDQVENKLLNQYKELKYTKDYSITKNKIKYNVLKGFQGLNNDIFK